MFLLLGDHEIDTRSLDRSARASVEILSDNMVHDGRGSCIMQLTIFFVFVENCQLNIWSKRLNHSCKTLRAHGQKAS